MWIWLLIFFSLHCEKFKQLWEYAYIVKAQEYSLVFSSPPLWNISVRVGDAEGPVWKGIIDFKIQHFYYTM